MVYPEVDVFAKMFIVIWGECGMRRGLNQTFCGCKKSSW